jgi:hypothetical protein
MKKKGNKKSIFDKDFDDTIKPTIEETKEIEPEKPKFEGRKLKISIGKEAWLRKGQILPFTEIERLKSTGVNLEEFLE